MQSEILDIVDEDGIVIGEASREECHRNPKLIHQVVHCWIFNDKGQILWHQRSLKKDSSPGAWDMSCGGHVVHGETPNETLKRELQEELGIIGVNPILVEEYIRGNESQTELIYLYYFVDHRKENEFKIDPTETKQVKWIDIDDARSKALNYEVDATEFIFSQVDKIRPLLHTTFY